MKESYLYIRVSTDEQAEKGYSLRAQEETLRRYCELNNIFVKGVFIEDHSAKTFNRPKFMQMLLSIRKHRSIVRFILFTKWDRFSRNAGDAYGMITTLNKLGVEPQAVEQPLDLEVPENKMMLAFYLAAPEVENHRKALNVALGMRRATKEGRWPNKAPIGYINTMVNGKKIIAPDVIKGPLMVKVFEQIAENKYSIDSIRREAFENGLHCKRSAFYATLKNPVYYGKILLKSFKDEAETLVDGIHEPIISEELFYRTQEALKGRKRITKPAIKVQDEFPLRGFIICPSCKRLLTASASTGRRGIKYRYYHCSSSCGTRFKSDNVNTDFVNELAKWKPNKAIIELYKVVVAEVFSAANISQKSELNAIKKQLQQIKDRSNKARDLLMNDALNSADYKSIKQECEHETILLEARVAHMSEQPVNMESQMIKAVSLLSNIDGMYNEAATFKKREIIGSMFPQKLEYCATGFRTTYVNEAVRLIFNIGAAFLQNKSGQKKNESPLSTLVTRPGFEPRQSEPESEVLPLYYRAKLDGKFIEINVPAKICSVELLQHKCATQPCLIEILQLVT